MVGWGGGGGGLKQCEVCGIDERVEKNRTRMLGGREVSCGTADTSFLFYKDWPWG